MRVIVKNKFDQTFRAYVKGSPEKIADLCDKSTLPANFDKILETYTQEGYRVIALAVRFLSHMNYITIQSTKRDKVENNLKFLGFLVMENKLKPVTKETIKTLNDCKIRTIMATGDNTLTAISVGRDCNILDKEQEVYFGDI